MEDRRSVRERKPIAKLSEMQSLRQRSSAAIEHAFSIAQDEQIDVPSSYNAALQSKNADKWMEAYESEMTSLVNHGTFLEPLDNVPARKNIFTAKIVLDLKIGGGK